MRRQELPTPQGHFRPNHPRWARTAFTGEAHRLHIWERPLVIAVFTLLHLLAFVYWLGGDLGAFYISAFIIDPKRTTPERAMALKALSNLDMAPRTALILTLPTGLTLAMLKGWWNIPYPVLVAIWLFCLGWLALAWAVHLRHSPPKALERRADLAIRWVVLAILGASGLGVLFRLVPAPLFIGLKLLILAACISIGLAIRILMTPLGPPLAQLLGSGPTIVSDAAIVTVMARVRPVVLLLWALVLSAAFLGAAKLV